MLKKGYLLIFILLSLLTSCDFEQLKVKLKVQAGGNGDGYDTAVNFKPTGDPVNGGSNGGTNPSDINLFYKSYILKQDGYTCINENGEEIISYVEKLVFDDHGRVKVYNDICQNQVMAEFSIYEKQFQIHEYDQHNKAIKLDYLNRIFIKFDE